jgi:hypothetical protein
MGRLCHERILYGVWLGNYVGNLENIAEESGKFERRNYMRNQQTYQE